MHPLAKYVLFSSAAVGLAWAAVTVDVGGRTPYGHVLAAGGDTWLASAQSAWRSAWSGVGRSFDGLTGDDDGKAAKAPARNNRRPAPAKPAPAAPTVQEDSGARQRVALLRDAQKKAAAPAGRAQPAEKTKLDAPMTKSDRAALDRLVAGR